MREILRLEGVVMQRYQQIGTSFLRSLGPLHETQGCAAFPDQESLAEPRQPQPSQRRLGKRKIVSEFGHARRADGSGLAQVMADIERDPESRRVTRVHWI